jgi:hypothetical protein
LDDRVRKAARPATRTERTTLAVREVLEGRRRGALMLLPFAGPAVVVSVAYMDPGNFATNIQAGARYGYALLWVVLLANLVAMLFQALSAKLGIVTGKNLAELCRERFSKPVLLVMWGVSEIAAMATDLAEFLGGAIGLSLLFHMPLLAGMVVTAVVTYGLLLFESAGFRPLELAIGALVGIIGLSYLAELFITPIAWPSVFAHTFSPQLPDANALTIAVGIVGATVMPHALPALRAHATASTRENRARARKVAEILEYRGRHRTDHCRFHQYGDGYHGCGRISSRASRGRGDRNGLSHAGAATRHWGGGDFPVVADRFGHIEFRGRHDGGSDDHARVRGLSHSAMVAPGRHDGAEFRRGGAWGQRDSGARPQSGGIEPRVAAADGSVAMVHLPRGRDGPIQKSRVRCRDRHAGGIRRLIVQCRADIANVRH